jgi:hypothetical protein
VVGSCSAAGQCLTVAAECGLEVSYCGCSGQTVTGFCGTEYATGPTLGIEAPCGPAPTSPIGSTLTTLSEQTQSAPEHLATDGTNVYAAGTSAGTVTQVAVAGGAVVTLATHQNQPIGIAVSAGNVFWTNESSGSSDGTVMSAPVGGGTAPVAIASGQSTPFGIAVGGGSVFWTNIGNIPAVMTAPVAPLGGGSAPTVFAAATSPWAIVTDGTNVYWSDDDSIYGAPFTSGASPVTIASGQAFPFDLAVDGTSVYWSSGSGTGAVMSAPKTGGGTPTTLASGMGNARLAVDATSLYFTSPGSGPNAGLVESLALPGGTPATTLVTGQSTPEAIVVCGGSLCWVDTFLGAVMELSPK